MSDRAVTINAGLHSYMTRVYNYMAVGVTVSGSVAWITFHAAVNKDAVGRIADLTAFGQAVFSGPAVIVLLLATLGLVFLIRSRVRSLRFPMALALFMLYAALLGGTLSLVFLQYTLISIARMFFISAASFAALSVWHYSKQRDLTALASFMIMGLFGIIIASLVNSFLNLFFVLCFFLFGGGFVAVGFWMG